MPRASDKDGEVLYAPRLKRTCHLHHASAADVIARVVHIKASSDSRVVDWLLGRSRFQSREPLSLAHRVSRAPVTDVVLRDLIARITDATNPQTKRQQYTDFTSVIIRARQDTHQTAQQLPQHDDKRLPGRAQPEFM